MSRGSYRESKQLFATEGPLPEPKQNLIVLDPETREWDLIRGSRPTHFFQRLTIKLDALGSELRD
jgi:hypothetical protein